MFTPIDSTNNFDFIIDYSLLDSSCGGEYIVFEGHLSSPNIGGIYPENMECVWTIQAAAGNNMNLNIFNLDIFQSNSDHCDTDNYLEIREVSLNGKLLDVLCGNKNETKTYSAEGFWIKFQSGTGFRGKGFEISFKSCEY